jgi:hypothetical protein
MRRFFLGSRAGVLAAGLIVMAASAGCSGTESGPRASGSAARAGEELAALAAHEAFLDALRAADA